MSLVWNRAVLWFQAKNEQGVAVSIGFILIGVPVVRKMPRISALGAKLAGARRTSATRPR